MASDKAPRYVYSIADLCMIGCQYLFPIFAMYFKGLTPGLIISLVLWLVKQFLVRVILGLDPLSTIDEFFLLDWSSNRSNIVTLMKLSKIDDYDAFRSFMIEKCLLKKRVRSKLVKLLGEYYFKEIKDPHELQKAIQASFISIEDGQITNDRQVQEFIAKEQTVRDPHGTFQFKMFVIMNYSSSESVLILKTHHCMMDGVSTITVTGNMAEGGYRKDRFHRIAPQKLSLFGELVKYLSLPVGMVLAFNSLFAYSSKRNRCELIGKRLTGERRVTYSEPLSTAAVIDKIKKAGISVNEYVFSIVTMALSELIKDKDDVQACVPFTLRDFPATYEDLQVDNDFACLPKMLYFPKDEKGKRIFVTANNQVVDERLFKDTLLQVMKETKASVRSSKGKFEAFGWYYMMKAFLTFLRPALNFKPHSVAKNYFTVLSIVPGAKVPLNLAYRASPAEVKSLVYFVPGQGRLGNGISIITNGDHLQLGMLSDTSYFPGDSQSRFVRLFELLFKRGSEVL